MVVTKSPAQTNVSTTHREVTLPSEVVQASSTLPYTQVDIDIVFMMDERTTIGEDTETLECMTC